MGWKHPTEWNGEEWFRAIQVSMILLVYVAFATFRYEQLHPRPYDEGWNACVAQVQASNPVQAWPLWLRNVTLNLSNGSSYTQDNAQDAAPTT